MSEPRMISCQEALQLLFTYLDGELDSPHRLEMEVHLGRCKSCFSRAEFERRLKEHLAALKHERVPPTTEARIRSVIHEFTTS